jgi:tetratricopeptide (TPR) repeat protein
MQNFAKRLSLPLLAGAALLLGASHSFAQIANPDAASSIPPHPEAMSGDAETVILDEVISSGTIVTGQHDGMDAFFRGDFETAEIEFEREFKGLKRFESARENAAQDAVLSADRALMQANAGDNAGAQAGAAGRGGGSSGSSSSGSTGSNSSVTSNFVSRRKEGRTILTDGKVTYEDFGFTRYMAGLSEIKLGKFDEARVSLKQSLRYDETNYDARMRLGLLNVMDADFEAAAKQLETIDKQRRRCERLSCDDLDALQKAAIVLAKQITQAVETK